MRKLLAVLIIAMLMAGTAYAQSPRVAKCDRATGAAALAQAFSTTDKVWLTSYRLHLSAAATQETLTLAVDSAIGTAYDTVLLSQSLVGVADVVYIPAQPLLITKDEVLDATWTNTDTRTYGSEICYEY